MKRVVAGVVLWHFLVFSSAAEEPPIDRAMCQHTMSATQAYDCCIDICMQIWTELDILSAIRTSTEDLMYFADKLIDKLLTLQHALSMVEGYHCQEPYGYEDLETINDIARHIDDRFFTIFSTINSKETACCAVLIERVLTTLEECSFRNSM